MYRTTALPWPPVFVRRTSQPLRSIMPSRALAEHAPLEEDAERVSQLHLDRLLLTREEYSKAVATAAAARAVHEVAIRTPGLSNADRHDLEARFHAVYGRCFLKCQNCWLLPGMCVCQRLTVRNIAPHHVALLVHHKEAGRASNTGCLLTKSVGATMHMSGLLDDEAKLDALLAAKPGTAAVLWPGEGAASAEEWKASLPSGAFDAGITLIGVDGTWGCARRMVKRIPASIPRISLPADAFAEGKSLLYPVRKYRGECLEKHCTYEATLAGLCTLGIVPLDAKEQLLLNLKCKVDALLIYKNRATAYSGETGISRPTTKRMAAAHAGLESSEDDDDI